MAHSAPICPTVVLDVGTDLKFSSEEKKLLCGDQPGSGKPWSVIPPAQARFEMRAFLQTRGYNNPVFQIKDDVLHVDPGPLVPIRGVTVQSAPPAVDISRKRDIVGQKLTPSKLNEIENWIDLQLRFNGYPCPRETSAADGRTGLINVVVDPGPKEKVTSIDVNNDLGLKKGVLRRYDAFQTGAYFNEMDLSLTERRMIADNVVAATHFTTECTPEGAAIHQLVDGTSPQILTAGIGFNTEEYLLTQTTWQHSRLDDNASSVSTTAHASFRIQQLTAQMKWYRFHNPRNYLNPSVTIIHDKEQYYETNNFTGGLKLGTTWDETSNGWLAEIGPDWQQNNTVVGVGPSNSNSLFLDGRVQLTSHDYEYYQGDPRQGLSMSLNGSFSQQAVGSTLTAQKIFMNGEALWNILNLSPPLVVQGLRWGLGTTITGLGLNDTNLPTVLRNFLGGDRDIRGFSRQELPVSGLGALTYAFVGIETRYNGLLPFNIEPSVFVDAGELGMEPVSLGFPIYWSPGLGLRWASPVGVLRVTLAHGYAFFPDGTSNGTPSHFQFYFSYGEEF